MELSPDAGTKDSFISDQPSLTTEERSTSVRNRRAESILNRWRLALGAIQNAPRNPQESTQQGAGQVEDAAETAPTDRETTQTAKPVRGFPSLKKILALRSTKNVLSTSTNKVVPEIFSIRKRSAQKSQSLLRYFAADRQEDKSTSGYAGQISQDSHNDMLRTHRPSTLRLAAGYGSEANPTPPGSPGSPRRGHRSSLLGHLSPSSKSFADAARTALRRAKRRNSVMSIASRWKASTGKNSAETLARLAPYVPRLLKDRIREMSALVNNVHGSHREICQAVARGLKPSMTQFRGVVMVADVTGFTKLTETLSKRGPSGVELLTKCMNSYFSKVMDLVFDFDGDVTKFAGDSMIIAFYPTKGEGTLGKREAFKATVLRAVHCAHELTTTLGRMYMLPNGDVVPASHSNRRRWNRKSIFAFKVRDDLRGDSSTSIIKRASIFLGGEGASFFARVANTKIGVMRRLGNASRAFGHQSRNTPEEDSMVPRYDSDPRFDHTPGRISNVQFSSMPSQNRYPHADGDHPHRSQPQPASSSTRLSTMNDADTYNGNLMDAQHSLIPALRTDIHEILGNLPSSPKRLEPIGFQASSLHASPVVGARGSHAHSSLENTPSQYTRRAGPIAEGAQYPPTPQIQQPTQDPDEVKCGCLAGLSRLWNRPKQKPLARKQGSTQRSKVSTAGSLGMSVAPRTPDQSDKFPENSKWTDGSNSSKLRASVENIRDKISKASEDEESTTHVLALKVMLGAGSVYVFEVGGYDESSEADTRGVPRFEFFIGDKPHGGAQYDESSQPPIEQIQAIEDFAEAGDVIVSKEVVNIAGNHFHYQKLGNGAAFRVLATFKGDIMKTSGRISEATYSRAFALMNPRALMHCMAIIKMHVMDSVRERVEAGQADFINEIRRLTIMFLGFPSLKAPKEGIKEGDEIKGVQTAMATVQRCMRQFSGSLLQFRCDEKGFLSICAFGLPGKTHSDNPVRAIQSALKILLVMKQHDSRVCIGITTGNLLCAVVGSKLRAEYTVFGDAINLSARLMCKAKGGLGEVLCDEVTFDQARRQARYVPLEPLPVKGKAEPVKVYKVEPLLDKIKGGKRRRRRRSACKLPPMAYRPLIGRDHVMKRINDQIEDTIRGYTEGGTILLEGDAGMGKTKIAYELQREGFGGLRHEANFFFSSAYASHKSHLLYPWRAIFKELFRTDLMLGRIEDSTDNEIPTEPPDVEGQFNSVRSRRNTRGGQDPLNASPTDPITQLGQMLTDQVDEYEEIWREFLAEALDIPAKTLPKARSLPCNLSYTGRRTTTEHNTVDLPAGSIILNDATRSLLSVVSFIHSLKCQMNMEGFLITPVGGKNPLKLAKQASVDSATVESNMNDSPRGPSRMDCLRKRASEDGVPKSDLAIRLAHRQLSIDSIIPPGAALLEPKLGQAADQTQKETKSEGGGIGQLFASLQRSSNSSTQRGPWSNTFTGELLDSGGTVTQRLSTSMFSESPSMKRGFLRSSSHEDVALAKNHKMIPMTRELKTQRLLDLLTKVLELFSRLYGPTIILIENVQHMDTVSWMLLNKLKEDCAPTCLTIVTLRPNDGSLATSAATIEGKQMVLAKTVREYELLRTSDNTMHIKLEALDLEQTRQFMEVIADGKKIPQPVLEAVWDKSSGVPMFVEQVSMYLVEKGMLDQTTTNVKANLKTDAGLADFIRNTVTVHHVIMDQIDRLRPSTHLTLKVAAVVCTTITSRILCEVYPSPTTTEDMEQDLEDLEQAGFIRPSLTHPGSWQFATMVARDVIYDLIPHTQRQQLHAKLASVLTSKNDASIPRTMIAFHWNQSCRGDEVAEWRRAIKAMTSWETAAEEAADKSAFVEALRLYQKAADIANILSRFYTNGGANQDLVDIMMKSAVEDLKGNSESSSAACSMEAPFVPVLVRVGWEREMARMCLQMNATEMDETKISENNDNAKRHVITALNILGAPLPDAEMNDESGGLELQCCFFSCPLPLTTKRGSSVSSMRGLSDTHKAQTYYFLDMLLNLAVSSLNSDPSNTALLDYCQQLVDHYGGSDPDSPLAPMAAKIQQLWIDLVCGGMVDGA